MNQKLNCIVAVISTTAVLIACAENPAERGDVQGSSHASAGGAGTSSHHVAGSTGGLAPSDGGQDGGSEVNQTGGSGTGGAGPKVPSCASRPIGLEYWWSERITIPPPMDLWFGAYEEISGNHASLAGSTSSEISFHGPVGDAFVFDGLRHLNISPPQDGSPLPLFGVEFWFSTNDANVPFIRSASGYFDLELEEGQVKLTLIDPSGTYSIAGGAMLADGKNHHVVANINTQLDQIELYVDGAFVDHKSALQLAPSTFILQSEGLTVGTDGTKVFTGFIDEISLYDTPVAMGEVDSLFHAGAVGKCPL